MGTDIEQAITKRRGEIARLQSELEHLEETQRILKNGSATSTAAANGKANGHSKATTKTPRVQPIATWAKHLPKIFDGKGKTATEVHKGLKGAGETVTLASLYQWLKRAQKRGAVRKRQRKFFYVGDAPTTN